MRDICYLIILFTGMMSCLGCGSDLVDASRLIDPENLNESMPDLDWANLRTLTTTGSGVLLTDPVYLADIYNHNDDELAAFLRANGVILTHFGGDTGADVWWDSPYLKMALSLHHFDNPEQDELDAPPGVKVVGAAGCDSGSFVFLSLDPELPGGLRDKVDVLVNEGNACVLPIPAGEYRFFYEQFTASEPNMEGLYRDIVAVRQ